MIYTNIDLTHGIIYNKIILYIYILISQKARRVRLCGCQLYIAPGCGLCRVLLRAPCDEQTILEERPENVVGLNYNTYSNHDVCVIIYII